MRSQTCYSQDYIHNYKTTGQRYETQQDLPHVPYNHRRCTIHVIDYNHGLSKYEIPARRKQTQMREDYNHGLSKYETPARRKRTQMREGTEQLPHANVDKTPTVADGYKSAHKNISTPGQGITTNGIGTADNHRGAHKNTHTPANGVMTSDIETTEHSPVTVSKKAALEENAGTNQPKTPPKVMPQNQPFLAESKRTKPPDKTSA
jgi:hypothetical protein